MKTIEDKKREPSSVEQYAMIAGITLVVLFTVVGTYFVFSFLSVAGQ